LQVRVGIQRGEKTNDEGVDMVDIAAFNEFGTANIPARPFMRQSADTNEKTMRAFGATQFKKALQGEITAEQAFAAIGVTQAALTQETVTKSKEWAEPNAESTIKKKSKNGNVGDVPLVDKSQLLQSLGAPGFVVVPKEGQS
jgi:hypothetical protein